MEELTVVYWRDIPAQVTQGKGRAARRAVLPERFEQAIDRAAMRAGLAGTDDYLAQWRRAPMEGTDPEALAVALDAEFTADRLRELIANDGWAGDR